MLALLGCILVVSPLAMPLADATSVDDRLGAAHNDASSHGDAGNTARLATPVEAGTWSGALVDPADPTDWYVVAGLHAGQRLSMRLDSGHTLPYLRASLHAAPAGDPNATGEPVLYRRIGTNGGFDLPLPHDGPWYVRVDRAATPVSTESPVVPYTLTVTAEDDPWSEAFTVDGTAMVHSLHWDTARDLAAYVRIETPFGPVTPSAGAFYVEYDLVAGNQTDRGFSLITFDSSGLGTVQHGEAPMGQAHAALVTQFVLDKTIISYYAVDWRDMHGSVRWTAYSTDPDARVSFAQSLQGPHQSTPGQPETPLRWTAHEPPGKQITVALPGASVLGPGVLRLDVEGRFIGEFDTYGEEGYAVDPTGTRHDLLAGRYLFLLEPTPGTWTFHLDARADVGRNADRTFFHGVHAPIDDGLRAARPPTPA